MTPEPEAEIVAVVARPTPQEAEIAGVAERLTEAQREAMLGRWGWQSPWAAEDGERDLELLGLWNPRPLRLKSAVLTPLGLAVKSHLQRAQGER